MLPIAKYEAAIVDLIDQAPAVVISGKTGCGKSTQVPQFILRRHPDAKIIVCQPRRVAATSLAVRVSEELKCKLGSRVGYHIGMESFREERCSIVYMTYGILIQQLLFMEKLPYTHIILDEIHERSLEMDFTFVALKKIINAKYQQRIKLVVMSATLNADLFCDYFCSNQEGYFHMP
jgi:ATP-dependent RNA helicase TDRD9